MDFRCKYCKCTGKGSELINGGFSDGHLICDLECPKYYDLAAFCQAPPIDLIID